MLSCTDVSYSYDGATDALAGVSLNVTAGELVCVVGANGSGKSTLARLLAGLLSPTSGTVEVCGQATDGEKGLALARRHVGIVLQNPEDQAVCTHVGDDVAFGPENLGLAPAQTDLRVSQALRAVGLTGFEDRRIARLSGGERQLVAIAGVLAMRPQAIVLDEATSMLDPAGRARVWAVAHDLAREGLAVVAITHHMDEAADASRVIALDTGRIALAGTPDEVLARTDELHALGLEPPLAARLSLALADAGTDVAPCVREGDLVGTVICAVPHEGQHATANTDNQQGEAAEKSVPVAAAGADASTAAPQAALALHDVTYTYPGAATPALEHVTLDVRQGELLGLAGPTGSGKSTLLRLLNGMERPTSGQMIAAGATDDVRRLVGVVGQRPERQLFATTVREDVSFGPRNLGLPEDEVAARVAWAADATGLDPALLDASPFALSGGERRRAAIAGVLAMRPEVLVLDEPAAGLDAAGTAAMLDLVRTLRAEKGLTVVMASHDMDALARLCDRVAVLHTGRVAALGTPEEVFCQAALLAKAGLDVPGPQRIARALIARGVALPSRTLHTEATLYKALTNLLA